MNLKQKSRISSSKSISRGKKRSRVQPETLGLLVLAGILSGCAGLPADRVASADNSAGILGADGQSATRIIGGKAINGYLENALVFSDSNRDGALSLAESFALTDRLGNYLLANPAVAPLVVKSLNVLTDAERGVLESNFSDTQITQLRSLQTKQLNSDSTQSNWTGILKTNLSTNTSGQTVNITPYTTLYQSLLEQVDADQAKNLIQAIYGILPDQDYVKAVAQGLVDAGIQAQANALTNLIRIAVNEWGDQVSAQEIFMALSKQLLEVSEYLESQNLSLANAKNLFTQADQIEAIYSALLQSLNLEIAVSDLQLVIQSAVQANQFLKLDLPISLVKDTGFSYDQITSDWRVEVSDIAPANREYLLKPMVNGVYGSPQISDQWLKDVSATQDGLSYKPTSEGFYRIFVRDQAAPNSFQYLDFYYDPSAPSIAQGSGSLLAVDSQIPEVLNTRTDKITSNAGLSTVALNQLLNEANTSLQYYVTRNIGNTAPAADVLWLNFYNLPRLSPSADGDQITVWLRAKDVAGNTSAPISFQFQFDPNQPEALGLDRIRLVNDTGLSGSDWVTQSLTLNDLQSWASSNRMIVEYAVRELNSDPALNWVRTYQAPQSDGQYELYFRVIDQAGNYSPVFSVSATRDTIAPVAIAGDELYLVRDTGFNTATQNDLITADPTVSGDRLPNTWFEYRIRDSQGELISNWTSDLNLTDDGAYVIDVRRIDLAGNYQGEAPSLELTYDGSAPMLSLVDGQTVSNDLLIGNWQNNIQNILEVSESFVLWRFNENTLSLTDRIQIQDYQVQVVDRVGHESTLWEYQTYQDSTVRTQMLRNDVDPTAIYAGSLESAYWDGQTSGNESIDYRVLGSLGNDLFKNLDSGDLYLGGQGFDVVEFATNANFLGIGFANNRELDGLTSLFSGVNPDLLNLENYLDSTPLLKLFSQSPFDETEQGLSFVQADLIRYTDTNGSVQTIYLSQDMQTGTYSLHLANANNFLFFDGQGVLVHGGNEADELIGGSFNDVFYGQSSGLGVDKLTGGLGDDIFVAGSIQHHSRDRTIVNAGDGDDRLYLVNGQLMATGGAGADSYYMSPNDYGFTNPLMLKVTDFEMGVDQLFLPDAIKAYALDHLKVSDDGLKFTIDLHEASLDASTPIGYGSTIELIFTEAVATQDAKDLFVELVLGDTSAYRSWDDLSKSWI